MTSIEWTRNADGTQGKSWNPVVGCSLASPGCTNCYAMAMAARIEAIDEAAYRKRVEDAVADAEDRDDEERIRAALNNERVISHYAGLTTPSKAGPVYNGKVALAPDHILTEPLRRKKPTTWFVNSMGDLFHENVPDAWIDRVFAVMALCPQHTFIVLTKRSARMLTYVVGTRDCPSLFRDEAHKIAGQLEGPHEANTWVGETCFAWPLPNVWLGVSTEDQRRADERIPDLLNTPAAVRFVSAEPLLGPIDFTRLELVPEKPATSAKGKRYMRAGVHLDALRGRYCESGVEYVGDWDVNLPAPPPDATQRKLDWVIVGGESGKGARPMHPDWARAIRDQCAAANVPFFFKQHGNWTVEYDRDREDPDWRRCPKNNEYPLARYLNLAGGHGFHGERVVYVRNVGKSRSGRLLDGRAHDAMPAVRQTETVCDDLSGERREGQRPTDRSRRDRGTARQHAQGEKGAHLLRDHSDLRPRRHRRTREHPFRRRSNRADERRDLQAADRRNQAANRQDRRRTASARSRTAEGDRVMTKAEATAALMAKGIVPRGLTRAEAAAYVGLSEKTFRARVKAAKLPDANPATGRWDRAAIDRALGDHGRAATAQNLREAIDAAIDAV